MNIDDDKKLMLYTSQDAIITDRGWMFQTVQEKAKSNIVEISASKVVENNNLSHLSHLTSKKLFQERNPDFDPYSTDASKRVPHTFAITGETIFTEFVLKIKSKIRSLSTETPNRLLIRSPIENQQVAVFRCASKC